jgi:hypothetical protein
MNVMYQASEPTDDTPKMEDGSPEAGTTTDAQPPVTDPFRILEDDQADRSKDLSDSPKSSDTAGQIKLEPVDKGSAGESGAKRFSSNSAAANDIGARQMTADAQSSNTTTETESTSVPSSLGVNDSETGGSLEFDSVYLVILVPVLLFAGLYAWFASREKKARRLANADAARGQFKKSERLKKSDADQTAEDTSQGDRNPNFTDQVPGQSAATETGPSINLEIEDDIFAGEKTSETLQKTSDFFIENASANPHELGGLNLSEKDEQMMFGEGKEAAVDRLLGDIDHPSTETHSPQSDGKAPSSAAMNTEDEPTKTRWRKKTFSSQKNSAPEGPAATTASPTRSDSQTDRLAKRPFTASTKPSPLNAPKLDSLEIRDNLTQEEFTHEHRGDSVDDGKSPTFEPTQPDFAVTNSETATADFSHDPGTTARNNRESELNARSDELALQNESLSTKLNTLQSELVQTKTLLAKQIDTVSAEHQQQAEYLREELAKAHDENVELQAKVVEALASSEQIQSLRNKNDALTEELAEAVSKIDQFSRLFQQSQVEKSELVRERDRLLESDLSLEQSKAEIEKLHQSIESLEKQKIELAARLKQLELTAQQEARDAKDLSAKLQTQTDELAELRLELQTKREEAIEMASSLERLDNLESELESATAALTEILEELVTKEGELNQTRSELTETREELMTKERELTNSRSELTETHEELVTKERQLKETRSALEESQAESASLFELEQDIEDLRNKLDASRERESELSQQLAVFRTSSQQSESTVAENAALKQQLEDVTSHKSELENKLIDLEAKASKLDSVQSKLSDIQGKLESTEAENQQLLEELAAAKQLPDQLEQRMKEQEQLKSELAALQVEKDEIANKLAVARDQNNTLEAEAAELQRKNEQVAALQCQIESLQSELEESRNSLETTLKEAATGDEDEAPKDVISHKTKRKFTKLYRAYKRERRLRKELELSLVQAEEQRDQVASDLRAMKQGQKT